LDNYIYTIMSVLWNQYMKMYNNQTNVFSRINIASITNVLSNLLVITGYNLLYGVSLCEIQLRKLATVIQPYEKTVVTYLKKNKLLGYSPAQTLQLINKHGDIIMCASTIDLDLDWDVFGAKSIVFSDTDVTTNCVHKIYRETALTSKAYTLSNVRFMSVELVYSHMYATLKLDIRLKTKDVNFYIVDNVLNANFIKYYLKNIARKPFDDTEELDYVLSIIDNNVNMFVLGPGDVLVFNKDGYTTIMNQSDKRRSNFDTDLSDPEDDDDDDDDDDEDEEDEEDEDEEDDENEAKEEEDDENEAKEAEIEATEEVKDEEATEEKEEDDFVTI
jgi:hypothetical protein